MAMEEEKVAPDGEAQVQTVRVVVFKSEKNPVCALL
jgi:hypothetical protein